MAREAKISRQDVLDAARGQIERGGLEGLTMRGIGKRLGVEAMSLYRHVGSRDQLLETLREELFSTVRVPEPGGDPRRDLEDLCWVIYRSLVRSPGARHLLHAPPAPSVGQSGPVGFDPVRAARLTLLDAMLLRLRPFIPGVLDRAYAGTALLHFVLGQVSVAGASDDIEEQPLRLSAEEAAQLSEVARAAEEFDRRVPSIEFELGLRALLNSIEGRTAF